MVVGLTHYLVLSAFLFGIGVVGVITRRNAIAVLMGVELMLNAANLNLLAFWRYVTPTSMEAQVFVLLGFAVAASEAAIGLAVILNIYREFGSVNIDDVAEMRG